MLWLVCLGNRKSSNSLYIINSKTNGIIPAIHTKNAAIELTNQFKKTADTPQATVNGINPIKP